jgi:hypothetical protein
MAATPRHAPILPGPSMPPKPKDFEDGTFPAEVHDRSVTQTVLAIALPQDATLTASMTAGAPFFKVVGISACDLVLQQVDPSDLPPGTRHPVYYWAPQNVVHSDGTKPLAVKSGQRVSLAVVADVPDGALAPGTFKGTVVLQGGSFSRTVALEGTYLAVDPNSLIGEKWAELGGEGFFGDVLSNAHAAPGGLGTVQEFANGALYDISGSRIRVPSHVPSGVLTAAAPPVAPTTHSTPATRPNLSPFVLELLRTSATGTSEAPSFPSLVGGKWSRFQAPSAKGAPYTRLCDLLVFYLSNSVYTKWLALAGAKDGNGKPVWNALGYPTEDTFPTPEGGQALRFQGGAIIVRANQQAYVTYGAIYTRYVQVGDISDPKRQPFLGLPTSDEQPALPSRGRVSNFDGGDIYWDLNLGAHEVHGAIRQHWIELGGAGGFLGLPVTDESGTPDGIGRFNRFEGGMIYWTPSTGAHEVHGAILDRWTALRFERSYLGYPVSDETSGILPPPLYFLARVSYFQFGRIVWTQDTGALDIPDSISVSQQVLTPAGTALGGTVTFDLQSNGDYSVRFQMHDSGIPDYDFQVTAVYTTPGGLSLAASHGGHVEGTISTTFWHAPNRDDDFTDSGNNSYVQMQWADIKQGQLWVTKDYSATGVIGFLEDVAKDIFDVAAGAGGFALGIVIGLGSEIGKVFGNLGIGATFGLIAGTVVFAFGGGVVLAVVTGVAVGLATNAMIKQVQISQEAYDYANAVFAGTLPPVDQIYLTNLTGLGGKAFTLQGADENIYVNIGDGYNDPIHFHKDNYQADGQLLIHELTHAWQIYHSSFLPGTMCKGVVVQANRQVGESVYQYGPPGLAWDSFGVEQQGAIVDQWFAGISTVIVPYRKAQDTHDPYFAYIRDNIRKGIT